MKRFLNIIRFNGNVKSSAWMHKFMFRKVQKKKSRVKDAKRNKSIDRIRGKTTNEVGKKKSFKLVLDFTRWRIWARALCYASHFTWYWITGWSHYIYIRTIVDDSGASQLYNEFDALNPTVSSTGKMHTKNYFVI